MAATDIEGCILNKQCEERTKNMISNKLNKALMKSSTSMLDAIVSQLSAEFMKLMKATDALQLLTSTEFTTN